MNTKDIILFNVGYTFHASFMRDFNWECAKYPMLICGMLFLTLVVDKLFFSK